MRGEASDLSVFFFPYMAHGHMIPMADMALLFSSRGVKSSIITTPVNAPFFSNTIQRSKTSGNEIGLKIIKFPCREAGLPDGCENADEITSKYRAPEMANKFWAATALLKDQIEDLVRQFRPDCLIADVFFPWMTDLAAKFEIPKLVFHGTGFFPLCADECIRTHQPHKQVSSDSDPFVVPFLPGEIELTGKELMEEMRQNEQKSEEKNSFTQEIIESEKKSYGAVVNSFYELESAYVDFYKDDLRRKAWHIGPLSICNNRIKEKTQRWRKSSVDLEECLKWMDLKKPNSVIYVCFGSIANFTDVQLMEIAKGLEDSGQNFVWVVRRGEKSDEEDKEKWLPDGFEDRTREKGLIIRGWAPQVQLLEHQATGGFVTHCGWNSVLEGITAGVPMVTWPVSAEQFYNDRLVTKVLNIGIGVGVKKWVRSVGDFVNCEMVTKAVREVMADGEEAVERRIRAKNLAEKAKRAVEEGGSSGSELNGLIDELRKRKKTT